MKKTIVLQIILFLVVGSLNGQTIFQIDSTSKWIQEEIYIETGNLYEKTNFALTVQGDTLINNTIYLKMYKDGKKYTYNHSHNSWIDTIRDEYYGAILYDSNKILMIFPNSFDQIPMYNFNVNIGDTIMSYIGEGLVVLNIDTLSDGRKKWITNVSNFFIVEGIGSNWGFIQGHYAIYYSKSFEATLGCYYQYDTLQFTYNQQVCDYNYMGIPNNHIDHQLLIYPNPVRDILRIDVKDIILESVIIYDAKGQIHKIDNSCNKYIDVSNLASGLYIIRINDKYTFKVIKD